MNRLQREDRVDRVTVIELLQKLQDYPPDWRVLLPDDEGTNYDIGSLTEFKETVRINPDYSINYDD